MRKPSTSTASRRRRSTGNNGRDARARSTALASAPAPPARNFSDILDVANILSRLPLSPAGVIAIITTLPIGD